MYLHRNYFLPKDSIEDDENEGHMFVLLGLMNEDPGQQEASQEEEGVQDLGRGVHHEVVGIVDHLENEDGV